MYHDGHMYVIKIIKSFGTIKIVYRQMLESHAETDTSHLTRPLSINAWWSGIAESIPVSHDIITGRCKEATTVTIHKVRVIKVIVYIATETPIKIQLLLDGRRSS